MKLFVILNPAAAFGRASKLVNPIQEALSDLGISATIVTSASKADVSRIVVEAVNSKSEGLVVAGGDGMLFDVINALGSMHALAEIPIGIVPVGTGNSTARELGLQPQDWRSALRIIAAGKTRSIDIGYAECGDYPFFFLNILGAGFVSTVNSFSRRLKSMGNFGYTISALLNIATLRPYDLNVTLDGISLTRQSIFIEISNTRYTADFLMAPNAVLDDGLLDVTLLNRCSRTRLIRHFPKIFNGTHGTIREVEVYQAEEIKFDMNPTSLLSPDGELLGQTPVTITCLPSAVRLFWS